MADARWMLYGATGFTGTLIAEEAVRRGHRPVLAGRSPARLAPLAERLGLEMVAVRLDQSEALARAVAAVDLVFCAAGPFVVTAPPMQAACLAAGTSYVDITGELAVFRHTYAQDAAARARGIALVSGAGFDVIPSDCLAAYVAAQVPGATTLETALATHSRTSVGTTRSALGMLGEGSQVRRNGVLCSIPLGTEARKVRFSDGERWCLPVPWGDLETAYRTTGIPNITACLAANKGILTLLRVLGGPACRLLRVGAFARAAHWLAGRLAQGPNEATRRHGRSFLWARASGPAGEAQAWLETLEAYRFTAVAGVTAVEHLLRDRPVGALSPAQALGADFILSIEDTRRLDAVPA